MKIIYLWSIGAIIMLLFGVEMRTDIKNLQADFEQIIITEDGLEASYFGTLQAKMPNKAKWIYKPPMQKEVYVNNGQVSIYEPPLAQVHIGTLAAQNDFFEILTNATPELDTHNKPTDKYRTTIQNTTYLITLNKKGLPIEISYQDSLQHTTTIVLKNHKINTHIADSVFDFQIPEGVDVINTK